MFLGTDPNALGSLFELEENNDSVGNKLRSDGPANKVGKLMLTSTQILFNLDDAHSVGPALGLNWEYIMRPLLVQSDINLIDFNLSHVRDGGAKMVLE